ncbi:MAG: hypothetical protein AB7O88_20995 [Reyranellaceae bacterium]
MDGAENQDFDSRETEVSLELANMRDTNGAEMTEEDLMILRARVTIMETHLATMFAIDMLKDADPWNAYKQYAGALDTAAELLPEDEKQIFRKAYDGFKGRLQEAIQSGLARR